MIVTRDAEDYIRSVHCAYNIIVIVSFVTTKSRNPRAHCTCALKVVLAERYLRIIPEFLPHYSQNPRCTYYAQNYAGIMYQCL